MIAIAFACNPALLIADEPTTALDVTVQAQVLSLMKDMQQKTGAGVVLITHDLGVVAEVCDRVLVMYAGRIVESATVEQLFRSPKHPYTQGLLAALPQINTAHRERLVSIPGQPPDLAHLPAGCAFFERCPKRLPDLCPIHDPGLSEPEPHHYTRCLLYGEGVATNVSV
ncbi:MAG: oppD 2 [Chthonomonadaceae bacterium]|nr:oppD 2 [Chthonomonadaceae bacterium]